MIAETIKAFLHSAQAWCLPLYFQLARTRYHSLFFQVSVLSSCHLPKQGCPLHSPLAQTSLGCVSSSLATCPNKVSVLYIRHLPKQGVRPLHLPLAQTSLGCVSSTLATCTNKVSVLYIRHLPKQA